ncbi:hypothetical protein FJT64_011818 [Amphibalanus amphitrite]|uniref:Uncharacterized protein n=1 Tax=Amphibalanus amphitrite TaxID=1232801 RepID=A0A6A4V181_AMPAM|nr:hypothetical protein FJT64_011818 [Amphibalanus amphitrite]
MARIPFEWSDSARIQTLGWAACDQFLCDDHCISSDLLCDGVVHCLHGGDESVIAGCVGE